MSGGQRESIRRIVLWDPSPKPSTRFLYGHGSSLGLFDWSPKEAEIKSVSNHQFQQGQEPSVVKCLAWSSHPVYNDLVAAATTAGRLQLIRFGSPASSGQDGPNSLATPPVFNIVPRVVRPCNAIAFSPQEPHHLAVGADKTRGDAGLNIWDIETAAKSLPLSGRDHFTSPRPPDRLQGRQTSSSDHRSETRVIYQHGIGETISALAFLPQTPSTIIVGAGGKYTRIVDMRLPPSGTVQIPNKFNGGLCVDPYDDHKFASFGEDAAIRVWDRRHLAKGPMLCFTEADAGGVAGNRVNSITTIAYSPSRRGILASLAADDSPVRLWSVLGGYYIEDPSISSGVLGPRGGNSVSGISPLADRAPMLEKTYFPPTLIKSQNTIKPQRLSNFCFATAALETSSRHNSHILSVSKEGVLQVTSVSSSPHHLWSPTGDLVLSHYDELSVGSSKTTADKRLPAEPWDIPDTTVGSPPRMGEASNILHTKAASSATEESRIGRSQRQQPLKPDLNFPPLPLPSTLSASRPPKSSRTYSPSGMRRFSLVQRTTSRTPLHSPNGSPTSKQVTLPDVPEPQSTSGRRPVPLRRRTEDSERFLRSSPSPAAAGPRYCLASMEGDISMVMKRRVQLGYSMKNALDNAAIARKIDSDGELLSQVWTTLSKFMDTLRVAGVAQIGGFDFTYQGLFGIWEGFPATLSPGPLSFDPAFSINPPTTPSPTPFVPQPQLNESPSVPNLTLPDPATRPPSFGGVRPNRLSIGSHGREASSGLAQSRVSTLVPDFDGAIAQLNQARLKAKSYSVGINRFNHHSLDVKSLRSGRRQLTLALCDWDLSRDDFLDLLRKWESEGQTTRAACWASLIGEFETANEYLLRSNDDLLHVVAGTVSAILTHRKSQGQGSSVSFELSPWRENCQRMITRLSDPYIRIMLSRLIEEPWIEILQDEAVRLTDRLGIIFRFLEDEKVSAALHATFENLKRGGELDGLLFTGLTSRGMDLVQAYVDRTGDVQTAAILGSYVCPARLKDSRVEHWVESYRGLLDQWKLFHFRCQFDIERGQMLQHLVRTGSVQPTEWVERQLFIRCNYCSKVISPKQASDASNTLPNTERIRTNRCSNCAKTLPRCVVCLMAIGISNDSLRDAELANETAPQDTLDEALVFCQTCRHGGHASHIFDWFFGSDRQAHTTCPVADCNCRCADL